MKSRNLIIILLILIFYVFSGVGTRLKLSSGIQLYIPFAICIIGSFVNKRNWDNGYKTALLIVWVGIITLVLRYLGGLSQESWQTVIRAMMPAMFILCLPMREKSNITRSTSRSARYFIDVFYVLECTIAVFEYATRSFVFGFQDFTYGDGLVSFSSYEDFRSASLLGNPLTNAFVVSTLMSFYIFDNTLTLRRKILFVALGMLAVFCFNARTSIVLNGLCIVLYSLKGIFMERGKRKLKYIVIGIMCLIVFMLALYMGMGTRLLGTDSFEEDGSIAVRLRAFEYIEYIDWDAFLLGATMDDVRKIMVYMDVLIIENFWLLFIFHLGLIFTVMWALLYFMLGRKMMTGFPLYDKVVIFLLFVVGASINNSCYSSYYPLLVLFLCCYIFNPIYDTVKIRP